MELCTPALIYVVFSLVQIIIDMSKGLFNTAFIKSIIMCIFTLLLNVLCQNNMGIISWILVFIPFLFMSIVSTILLYLAGVYAEIDDYNFKTCNKPSYGGNLIYSSTITPSNNMNNNNNNDVNNDDVNNNDVNNNLVINKMVNVPFYTSDPQYI